MIQRLLQAVRGKLMTSKQPTQPLLLEAPPMLNCLQHQQKPATPQGPISPEVSQSLVTPASTLSIAPVNSLLPQSIPTLVALSFYNIDNSSATLASLNSTESQAPTSGNTTNACKLICFNQNCPLLSAKARAIVDLHIATMNKVMPTPCLKPIGIEPVIDQNFVALNEDLLSIQTAPQLQVQVDSNHPPLSNKTNKGYFLFHCSFASTSHLTKAVALVDTGATNNFISKDLVDKLGLEYNPGALCKGGVSNVFCSFRLRCLLYFSITDHAFVAEFTVAKHLTYLVVLGVEWWQENNINPILKDDLLRIAHPTRISLEVPMALFRKEAPHISMSVLATTKHAMSFDVLLLCLSHLHTAFDFKIADGLPVHSQFDFEFKLTVNLVKVASPIYPLNLKNEQCLEEWTKDMEAKG
ncbi:hypothetical protein DSO57_1029064 [Entomophthora muscae]|uniref:Uncharacterized protein n=1 Tax=Entomophthora muscae TaxID=34485 RepID=A0ACC2TZJ5_9FUNG|nr:hypothetical protein DSO57_1029064 [Entomophthora muscae]